MECVLVKSITSVGLRKPSLANCVLPLNNVKFHFFFFENYLFWCPGWCAIDGAYNSFVLRFIRWNVIHYRVVPVVSNRTRALNAIDDKGARPFLKKGDPKKKLILVIFIKFSEKISGKEAGYSEKKLIYLRKTLL